MIVDVVFIVREKEKKYERINCEEPVTALERNKCK